MKAVKFFSFILLGFFLLFPLISQAEVKMDAPSGGVFPKLPKTADDPILENSRVYPFLGASLPALYLFRSLSRQRRPGAGICADVF